MRGFLRAVNKSKEKNAFSVKSKVYHPQRMFFEAWLLSSREKKT